MKKYLGILFFLSVFSLILIPSFSSAQTGDIDPNPNTEECISLENNLRYRDRDSTKNGEVSLLQDFLQSKGYLNSEPTGYFGILTFKAVKDFQRDNGINPTGYVGATTRTKIVSLTCGPHGDPDLQNPNFPAGCTSNQGYSTTTGKPCRNTLLENSSFKKILSNLTKDPIYTTHQELGIPVSNSNNLRGDCENRSDKWVDVLYPKGGESFIDGSEITIRWESCGMLPSYQTYTLLDIYDASGVYLGSLFSLNYPPVLNSTGNVTIRLPRLSFLQTFPLLKNASFGKNFKVSVLSYDPATNTELGTITGYMGTSRNLFTIDASTEPAGTYLIEKVTSLKSEYNPGDRANFMVYGIETIDKSPTENKEGFAIQSYVFNDLGDDKLSLSKMWLSSNPESSYNGNYDINSGSWIFDMFVPMIPGKYIQRSSLFCSKPDSYCDKKYGVWAKSFDKLTKFTVNNVNFQQGDVNGDGTINCTDSTWITESVLQNRTLTAEQKKRADMNGDGIVTTYDALLLSQQNNLNCGTMTPSITVLSPNGGEMFTKGESLGTGDFLEWSIKVNLSSKGDILYRLKNVNGSYVYFGSKSGFDAHYSGAGGNLQINDTTFPFPVGKYYFVATWTGGDGLKLEDQSDNYFTINAPTPTVSICSPITIDGITYSLNPCTITETMVDGQGNKNFSTTILSSNRLYSFSKRGYGEGFPVYSILGVSSGGGQGNTPVGLYFNDQVLSANGNLPKTYTGYLPIHIFHGSEGNDNNYLYLGVNLTVTPPPPTPDPDPGTPPPTGFILDSTPRIAGWGGKVAQHTDSQGNWISDPDGTSGVVETDAGRLAYCKKWFGNSTSVVQYKTETITTWKRSKYANDPSSYTNTVLTYKCINGSPISKLNKSASDLSLSANALNAVNNINTNTQIAPKALSETSVLACTSFTKILMKGMNDNEVKCLQQKLNEKGFVVAGTEGDNETIYFGYATETALKAFQLKNNLKADGIFGPQTRELFK